MTAESVVVNQISEDSKVQNEDKGLDEKIIAPKVAGDLKNGVNEHASNAKEETEDYDNNTNSNANGLGDPDHSYVFVSRKDSGNGDSIDWDLNVEGAREKDIIPEPEVVAPLANHVNGQLKGGEPEGDNGEILFPKDNDCIAECPVICPSDSTIGPDISPVQLNVDNKDVIVAQDQNARASVASEQEQPYPEAIEEHVEPVSAPDLKENQESSPLVLEVGTFDDGKIKFEEQTAESGAVLEPHEQADMESTIELGKVQDSHFLIPEAVNLHEATEKAVEENHLNSTAQCNESEEAHVSFSETSELTFSSPNDIKENSEEETEIEPTSELGGSQEYQAVVSEATECRISEVEVGKVSSSEQAESPCEAKENPKAQSAMPESEESESFQLDNGGEKLKEEEKTDFGVSVKEYEESQLTVNGNPGSNLNQGNGAEKLSTETNISLEPENGFENVLADNQDGCPTSQLEDKTSAIQDLYESIDASQKTTVQNGSSKNDNNLPLPDGCVRPETEDGSEPVGNNLCPVKDGKVAVEVEKMTDEGNEISNYKEMNSESDIGLSIDSEGKEINSSCNDVKTETEFPNMVTDGACGQPLSASDLIPVCHTNGSGPIESTADMVPKSEVENLSSANGMDVSCTDAVIPRSQVQFGSFVPGCQVNSASGDDSDCFPCQESKDFKQVPKNEVSTSSPKGFSTDVVIEQNVAVESVKRPFNFLIRIPRYDDEEHREQIRQAQLQVEQKTQQRDAIRFKIQMIRGNHQQIHSEYEAAKSEERAARGLVRLKRQEIDSVQSVINRVKNAISVEDIDVRINHMEHMIQHETLPLKEEKQFIREIKQLKHHREQLSSNMGSQDEVQQALDQRDQIEERLKILKKELDRLKDKVSIAEATAVAAGKKYNDESKRLKELHAQFRAADDVRQEAYMKLQNLRRQLYEKNGRFRTYKDDATAANEYASSRDKGALHHLCLSQVEKMMELWNNDDEFRKEYIRFNTKSTLRRLRTLDGRALGPDEESPVLPSVVDERIDVSLHQVGQPNSELLISDLEKEKLLSTVEAEKTEGKSIEEVAEQMDKTEKTKKPGKPTMRTGSPSINGRDETRETLEEEHEQTKEQEEARKERQFRKEEEEAKLKEQRRLEEIAKAKEALERKRKNAEKAQIRAEVRAQKEAEQKEKEREKKAKKKERKKAGAGAASENGNEGDIIAASLESSIAAIKEPEIKEGPATVTKRPQKVFTKQQSKTKSIPPPLRNKNKRRMQQWMWIIFTVMLVLAVILLGNIGFYSNLGRNRQMRSSGF